MACHHQRTKAQQHRLGSAATSVMEDGSRATRLGRQRNQAGTSRSRSPGRYQNAKHRSPVCLDKDPSYKIRQLLPNQSTVRVQLVDAEKSPPTAMIWRDRAGGSTMTLQEELVQAGFAQVRSSWNRGHNNNDSLMQLQQDAQERGVGLFCGTASTTRPIASPTTTAPMAEFEPLEWTTETMWMEEDGRLVRRKSSELAQQQQGQPRNPGDVRGCSDFGSYEDALQYYEYYFPYYGDVARLDRDGDGVPCPGLPHTPNQQRYRMKVPTAQKEAPFQQQ